MCMLVSLLLLFYIKYNFLVFIVFLIWMKICFSFFKENFLKILLIVCVNYCVCSGWVNKR